MRRYTVWWPTRVLWRGSQAWSSDWAVASCVDNENYAEGGLRGMVRLEVIGGGLD